MNIEQLENRLAIVKSAQKRTKDIFNDLGSEAGSISLASRINKPFLSLATTGDDNLDFLNTIRVATIRQKIEEKSFPTLLKYRAKFDEALIAAKNEEIGRLEENLATLEGLKAYIPEDVYLVRTRVLRDKIYGLILPKEPVVEKAVEIVKEVKIEAVVETEAEEQVEETVKRNKPKETKIPEMSVMQLKLLEILETSSAENLLTVDEIIAYVYEEELAANPGIAKALKDRLYVLLPQLRKSMEKRKDPRSIKGIKTGDKYAAKVYYLEQPVVEPEGMPAVGEIAFLQPQSEVVEITEQEEIVAEPELSFRIIDEKNAELVLPDGKIVKVRGEARIPFMQILVARTNDNNPVSEEELTKLVYGDRKMSNSNASVVLNGIRNLLADYGWMVDGLKTSRSNIRRYYLNKLPQKETQVEVKSEVKEVKELLFTEEDAALFMGMVSQVRIEGKTLESYLDPEMIECGKEIMERVTGDGISINPDKKAVYEARIKVIDKLLTIIRDDHLLNQIVGDNGYSTELQCFFVGLSEEHDQKQKLGDLLEELKDSGIKDMLYASTLRKQGTVEAVHRERKGIEAGAYFPKPGAEEAVIESIQEVEEEIVEAEEPIVAEVEIEEVVPAVAEEICVGRENRRKRTLEKNDPKVRETVNTYLDQISGFNITKPINSATISHFFPRIKQSDVDRMVENGSIKPKFFNGTRNNYPLFTQSEIVIFLYAHDFSTKIQSKNALKKLNSIIAEEKGRRDIEQDQSKNNKNK
ncbi:MAG: hypothetical protein WCV81_05890 [Microgenomates group bacterium]|jgi:DNA-binding winged helix-turn-helix (wHTH) protein